MKRFALASILLLGLLGAAPASAEPRVAVLYFDNVGNPELDMLRLGLAEMMIVDLSNRPDVAVIERNRINQVLGELDLQTTDKFDPSKAVEIGKLLGAERMVLGSYFELLGTLTVTASVVEVQTGQSIGGHKVQGQVAEFGSLLEQVTGGVTPALVHGRAWLDKAESGSDDADPPKATGSTGAVRGGGGGARTAKKASRPANRSGGDAAHAAEPIEAENTPSESVAAAEPEPKPEPSGDPLGAAMAFSAGLDYLDRKDLKRAREALQRAVDLDPSLDVARTELARIDI